MQLQEALQEKQEAEVRALSLHGHFLQKEDLLQRLEQDITLKQRGVLNICCLEQKSFENGLA